MTYRLSIFQDFRLKDKTKSSEVVSDVQDLQTALRMFCNTMKMYVGINDCIYLDLIHTKSDRILASWKGGDGLWADEAAIPYFHAMTDWLPSRSDLAPIPNLLEIREQGKMRESKK